MSRSGESSGHAPEAGLGVSDYHAALTDLVVNHPSGLLSLHYGLYGPGGGSVRDALLRSNSMLAGDCEFEPGQRVLDAGCGLGGTAIGLARDHGVRVIGLTNCAPHVEVAREHAERRGVGNLVEFQHGDFMDLPYADGSFDAVLNHESLCHAADKLAYLRGVHRVLKPGGRWQALDRFLNCAALSEDQEKIHAAVYRGWHSAPLVDWRGLIETLEVAGFGQIDVRDLASEVAPYSARMRNLWALRSLSFFPRSRAAAYGDFSDAVFEYDRGLEERIFTYCFLSGEKPPSRRPAGRPATSDAGGRQMGPTRSPGRRPPGRGATSDANPAPSLRTGRASRQARSRDFGGLATKVPVAVAVPRSADELAGIVRWAAREKVPLIVRGGGHSQGGQCLTDRGVVVDTVRLDGVRPAGCDLVRAQGGARWGRVLDMLRGTRRFPCVLADVPEVTVGGTLSAGGVGTTSHRYGLQVEQVEQLEVVVGTGERVRCSQTRNAELFDAVRAGQGQFGIMTEAWIRLRKGGTRIRRYELRYRDFGRFADDFELIVDQDRFDHLRVEMRASTREVILCVSSEYDRRIDGQALLAGLCHDDVVSELDTAEVGAAGMMPQALCRRIRFHPWRDWMLPWDAWRRALEQPWLDPGWLEGVVAWTGMYPIGMGKIAAPLFARPEGKRVMAYSILAVPRERDRAGELAGNLRRVDRTLVALGGKSYLSGDVAYGREEWREHYGDRFDTALAWKREFDPHDLFGAEGTPFRNSPATR